MKLSLSKMNFFNIVAIVVIFSIILSFFIYAFTNTYYEKKVKELQQNYYNHNKSLVKNEIERGIKRIEIIKNIIYQNTQNKNKKELDNEIEKIIFDEFKKDTFGDKNYGYFWIVGLDKTMRIHPFLEGENIDFITTLDGKKLVDEMIERALNSGGYVSYNWRNPHTNIISEKTSYVQLIPDFNLIIGAGFYREDLNKLLDHERKNLKTLSQEYLKQIYIILSILVFLSLIIARYLSSKIKQIENDREEDIHLLEQYRNLLDESSVVTRSDKNGIITYVNDSFVKVSGYTKESIIGKTHAVLRHPDTPKSQFKNLWTTILNGEIWKGILKNKRKNGESYYSSLTIMPIKNKEGKILRFISSATDITEHIENRTKLQNLFKTDSLTGLGNRVSLLNYIAKNHNVVLALINIDRFKEINDSFSHDVGDSVIKELGNRLFEHFNSKSYFLFRVQADVFAIVNLRKSKENVKIDVEQFIKSKENANYEAATNKFILTYTCGMASHRENLFAYADIALREAKNKKLKILEYDTSLKNLEYFKNNIQWVDRLHNAISEDNIIPHFQPIYNYQTGKIDKYEALMRMIEGDTIIYPNDFLDIAKKTKLYPELTYKMIEKVLDKFSTLDLEFSINLCIEDLMNNELTTHLYEYAKKKNVLTRMVLEIVESEEMEDNNYISDIIHQFKNAGTKIAIDDFGCGYSNYEYLISLQADYIKIDGSITKLIVSDNRTLDVVKSIVEFAKKSNIKIIAEFVSDESIDKVLREIGVDYAQGYYYGKPQAELV